MDVNVWLGGNNNIFSSVNKNIFSLSLAQWRVSSAHGCLIQVTKAAAALVTRWHIGQSASDAELALLHDTIQTAFSYTLLKKSL